jgi:hypothetical protein
VSLGLTNGAARLHRRVEDGPGADGHRPEPVRRTPEVESRGSRRIGIEAKKAARAARRREVAAWGGPETGSAPSGPVPLRSPHHTCIECRPVAPPRLGGLSRASDPDPARGPRAPVGFRVPVRIRVLPIARDVPSARCACVVTLDLCRHCAYAIDRRSNRAPSHCSIREPRDSLSKPFRRHDMLSSPGGLGLAGESSRDAGEAFRRLDPSGGTFEAGAVDAREACRFRGRYTWCQKRQIFLRSSGRLSASIASPCQPLGRPMYFPSVHWIENPR